MKPFSFLLMLVITSLAVVCDPNEDEVPFRSVSNPNIVSVQGNPNSITVNTSIIIETNIGNNQTTTNGEQISLTDFYSTIPQETNHALFLYRQVDNTMIEQVDITENMIEIIEGDTALIDGVLNVISVYNGTSFNNSTRLVFDEPGTYFLAGSGLNAQSQNGSIVINAGSNDIGVVSINTQIINSDNQAKYTIIVTE